jgi:hypothetical protein
LTEPIRYRAATKDDLRFVLSSWVRSYTHRRKPPEGMSLKGWRAGVRVTIADLLRRTTTRAVVACNPLNDTLIWGFAIFDDGPEPVLHYCYVKEVFRGNGIGTELTRMARNGRPGSLRISYRTPACRRFLPEAVYQPRLLRKPTQEINAAA